MKPFKKFPQLISLLLVATFMCSCATIYRSPDLESRTNSHQKVAFLPFEAVIQYKRLPKNTTVEQIKEMEEDMGYVFQEQMYARFLRKIQNYEIEFQDISRTNALLKKAGVDYTKLKEMTKEEVAKILGVDAVISGRILTSKPMSTAGAIAVSILTDYSGATNRVDVNVSLHDGVDGKLLYKFDHEYSGGVGSSAEQLTKSMMKTIERKFPYRK